ncbi:hypothetical protein LPJ66_001866, partial [Kickxella alabastrina]
MSGQHNLNAMGNQDWRASVPEQARSQNLAQISSAILQGFNESQRASVIKVLYQFENLAFTSAQSSQEYVSMLHARVAELDQKLKILTGQAMANNQAAAAGLNQQFVQQTPVMSMMSPPQQPQQQPQLVPPVAVPSVIAAAPAATPVQAPGNTHMSMQQMRDVINFPQNHTTQDITMALHIIQAQMGQSEDKQRLTEVVQK